MKKELVKPLVLVAILAFIILTAFAAEKGGFSQIEYVLLSPTGKLYWAIRENDTKKLSKLLDKKPDLVNSAMNRDGYTPLHWASRLGHYEIAEILLEHGADPNIKAAEIGTPLNIAVTGTNGLLGGDHKKIERERLKILKLLLSKGAGTDTVDREGRTPLLSAAQAENMEAVTALLEAGAAVNDKSGDTGCALIKLAAERKDREFLKLLQSKNLSLDIRNNEGETPLHLAVTAGDITAVKTLISWGVKVDSRTGRGETPLYIAAIFERTDAAKILIDNGADVNAPDNEGNTPLKMASQSRNPDMQKFLIENGAKK